MIYYLFYKLYRATLKGSLWDIAKFASVGYLSILVYFNIVSLSMLLAKLNILPYINSGKKYQSIELILSLYLFFHIFLRKKFDTIIDRYDSESDRKRKNGNLIVSLYVTFSVLFLAFTMIYRPGEYLGKING